MKFFNLADSKEVEISNGVKNIIFITLSNIGDVVLTLPSLDYLKNKFKEASFTVLSGPNASVLFSGDPRIKENIVYNKHMPFRKKIALFRRLGKENFDVIIDLRDTAFRWFVKAGFKNPYICKVPFDIKHLRLRHLYKTIKAFKEKANVGNICIPQMSLNIGKEIIESADSLLKKCRLSIGSEYIVVCAGARSQTKRWHKEGFTAICNELLKHYSIIFIGDKNDSAVTLEINRILDNRCIDLTGRTNLLEAIAILKNAKLVISNDSAILHIASYLNKPILALFGPTDENKYGPWSGLCAVVRKNTVCSPCGGDDCKNNWQCMRDISYQLVIDYAYTLLAGKSPKIHFPYRRILISRTDRLGDVLLSTPVIKNLRENAPGAYIAMMINSSLEDILKGNPYLDEVILFDKKRKHCGLINSIHFAIALKKKKFDLALILHPAVRIHLLLFFAGIKERLGYDIKYGFLNTRIIKHTKQFGEKHESEYTLDFLRELGVPVFGQEMYMPVYRESEKWAEDFLKERSIDNTKFAAVHMQASCPSKLWPRDYFNRLVDDITYIYKINVIYVGADIDKQIKETEAIINLSGKTNLAQLASILKRCSLFISNDSGPVHMAVALGVPAISIFGRKQPGLGPKRWGPLSEGIFLHKDVGCEVCLAHNCEKDFSCLKAIDPKEVLVYVDKFLSV